MKPSPLRWDTKTTPKELLFGFPQADGKTYKKVTNERLRNSI